ncbi:unnamed protein product [Periconia digitata]|uniref:Uncharacterized protein n=1 Tax=Periconia digitata TaxID=1303443 RepID=A0A9W4UAZ4_9PLEO|nr:unnamed protein product [Periconia digitata]
MALKQSSLPTFPISSPNRSGQRNPEYNSCSSYTASIRCRKDEHTPNLAIPTVSGSMSGPRIPAQLGHLPTGRRESQANQADGRGPERWRRWGVSWVVDATCYPVVSQGPFIVTSFPTNRVMDGRRMNKSRDSVNTRLRASSLKRLVQFKKQTLDRAHASSTLYPNGSLNAPAPLEKQNLGIMHLP